MNEILICSIPIPFFYPFSLREKAMIDYSKLDWDRTEDLTIEEVLATKGCTHFSREQAQEFIDLIKIYCQCIMPIAERSFHDELFYQKLMSDDI